MIANQQIQTLADTLAKSGLAASPNEAIRMAQNIIGTEQRVAKEFDKKNNAIDQKLEKRSYEDEVNYLIEKTSPENKKFHIPIKGYVKEEDLVLNTVEAKENNKVMENKDFLDAKADSHETQAIKAQDQAQMNKINEEPLISEIPEPQAHQPHLPDMQTTAEVLTLDSNNAIKPVITDVIDDERTLNEIMNEDAKVIYTNAIKKQVPQPLGVKEVHNNQSETKDSVEYNFIKLEEEPKDNSVQITGSVENKPKTEPKNPIPDVDLMEYFKFG